MKLIKPLALFKLFNFHVIKFSKLECHEFTADLFHKLLARSLLSYFYKVAQQLLPQAVDHSLLLTLLTNGLVPVEGGTHPFVCTRDMTSKCGGSCVYLLAVQAGESSLTLFDYKCLRSDVPCIERLWLDESYQGDILAELIFGVCLVFCRLVGDGNLILPFIHATVVKFS